MSRRPRRRMTPGQKNKRNWAFFFIMMLLVSMLIGLVLIYFMQPGT